jgi:hypothetical protein
VQDQPFNVPTSSEPAAKIFEPGSHCLDDPRRKMALTGQSRIGQHINVIYPRRDLAALIAACFPVVNDMVVMRFKPVFTTAGTQPYGGMLPSPAAC